MQPIIISIVAFALMFGAAVGAARLRAALPDEHLSADAKDVVARGIGFVVTLAALVLSLLIASGKTSYDEVGARLRQLGSEFVLIDRAMAHYGADAAPIRETLWRTMTMVRERIWSGGEMSAEKLTTHLPALGIERVEGMIRELTPANERQRVLQSEALSGLREIKRTGWLLVQLSETQMPKVFLIIIILWLVIVFFGFGLVAPVNRTVTGALLFCALCAACAIFLILELYAPVSGLLAISPRPFEISLSQLGR